MILRAENKIFMSINAEVKIESLFPLQKIKT